MIEGTRQRSQVNHHQNSSSVGLVAAVVFANRDAISILYTLGKHDANILWAVENMLTQALSWIFTDTTGTLTKPLYRHVSLYVSKRSPNFGAEDLLIFRAPASL